MDIILKAVQFLLDMGGTIILPFFVTILGIIFGLKFIDSFKNGLMIGVGFSGIMLIVDLLVTTVSPATEYYTKLGTGFTTVNLGWDSIAAMAWSTSFALWLIPLGFLLNFILVRLKVLKTLNVDIWNFYSAVLTAAVTYYIALSLGASTLAANIIGLIVGLSLTVVACKIGDILAKSWQGYFNMPKGVTCSTLDTQLTHYPVSWLGAKLYDLIPGLNKLYFDINNVNEKYTAWTAPSIVGFLVGGLLGLITKQNFSTILTMAIGVASVIVLMPKMVSLLMDGLVPLSNAARTFMKRKLGEDADILIGMDVSIGLGDKCGMIVTMFLMPITILLAFVLPNITFFPIGLFGGIIWSGHAAAFVAKGNLPKAIFAGTFLMAWTVITLNFMAPIATQLAYDVGVIDKMTPLVTGGGYQQTQIVLIGLIGKLFGGF
ncbi:PTS transporter subunit IIC [uncultured Anaerofustis sp.]|uniref:PTS transporter subunit IIC n=1 Tax=uncultured Anaerofustis sp. TaxID=904996 RepID=UPI0025F0B08A|nr:PTS transporter subunit IIC [uncultured Anaerofustis sp.]